MADETTLAEMMDSPDDVKLVVRNLLHKISALELKCDDQQGQIDQIEAYVKPIRWIFNKVIAGLGLAVAAAILAWFGMDL